MLLIDQHGTRHLARGNWRVTSQDGAARPPEEAEGNQSSNLGSTVTGSKVQQVSSHEERCS